MLAAGAIQKAGLDTGIAPHSRISRILSHWRKLHIVLTVYSQALDYLKGVLLMFVRVGVRGFEERRRYLAGVSTVSTDQSHWRQKIVNWVSTGLVIALPPQSCLI